MSSDQEKRYRHFVVFWNKRDGFTFLTAPNSDYAWDCDRQMGFQTVIELEVPSDPE